VYDVDANEELIFLTGFSNRAVIEIEITDGTGMIPAIAVTEMGTPAGGIGLAREQEIEIVIGRRKGIETETGSDRGIRT
jgi:hypothetical protein